jgi:hypothetical protein
VFSSAARPTATTICGPVDSTKMLIVLTRAFQNWLSCSSSV